MKKGIVNITGAQEVDFVLNQVYVCERVNRGRICKVYDLRTDCKRESTAVKRLVSVVPELTGAFEAYTEAGCNEIAVEALEDGYYVMAVIFDNDKPNNVISGEVIYSTDNGDIVKTFDSFEDAETYYHSIQYIYNNVQLWFVRNDEKFLDSETTNPRCSLNKESTNINKENDSMEEKETINPTEIVDTQELLPIEPEYITRVINQANLVNEELAERTRDILYLEDDNRRNLFKIASQLAKINRANLYKDDGFKNVSEYAEKVLGYKGSTTRALCRIADRFLTETGEIENPELADFTVYQLMEILKLNDSELQLALNEGTVSSELSTKKLRDNVKKSKETSAGGPTEPEQRGNNDRQNENEPNDTKSEQKKESDNKPNLKGESSQEDEDIKYPDNRGEAIVILTSLIAEICKNEHIGENTRQYYTDRIKQAIRCIK